MTVRERVKSAQRELIHGGELLPQRACQLLMELTALLGKCSEEIRAADAAFAVVLLREMESNEKMNVARLRAETSPEYQRRQEARGTHALVVELVRSLKIFIKSQQEELRMAR